MVEKAKKDNHPLVSEMELERSSTHDTSKFVYRWVSHSCGATIPRGTGHTELELKIGSLAILTGKVEAKHAFTLYGFSDSVFRRFVKPVCKQHSCRNVSELKKAVKDLSISRDSLCHTINDQSRPTQGRPPLLTPDEEVMIIGTAEVKAQYGCGKTRRAVSKDLNAAVEAIHPGRNVKPDSARRFGKRVLERVNAVEPGREGGKKSRTGVVKASKLSMRRAKQSDPRLQWMMAHRIAQMYRDAKRQQIAHLTGNAVTPTPAKRNKRHPPESTSGPPPAKRPATASATASRVASISTKSSNLVTPFLKSTNEDEHLFELNGKFYIVPDDLDDIQPRADQIWNADEIGFDPDGKWDRVVCTFKWCMSDKLWMTKTGEKAPFWVSMLYFVRADGMCHLPPTICHKSKNLNKSHTLYLPNWTVHATESGYFDRDGFFKSMTAFVQQSNTSAANPQFLFLDGHDSHWDADALKYARDRHVHVFFLKAGDSENDQPLDNGPNALLKRCYYDALSDWEEQYPNTALSPAYFNMIVAKAFEEFKLKCAVPIKHAFEKTHLFPLRFPLHSSDETVGLASIASLQVAPGKAADELERITTSQNSLTCELDIEETTDRHMIIRAKQGENADRNLVVRSAVNEIVNRVVVKPAQEVAKEFEMHKASAKTSLGPAEVSEQSRMNPDTSKGLYVTDAILAQAQQIEKNKAEVAAKKKQNAKKAEKDRVENRDKRRALYDEFVQEYGGKTLEVVDHAARNGGKLTGNTLMAIFQHLGGRPKDLDDTKKATVLAALRCNPWFLAVVENDPSNESDTSSPSSDESVLKTTADSMAHPTNSVARADTKKAPSKNDSDKTGHKTEAPSKNDSDKTGAASKESVQQYGLVVSVPGDGNCGYHAMYHGLHRLGLVPGGMAMGAFRKELFDFASTSSTQLVLLGNLNATPPISAKFVNMKAKPAYPAFRDIKGGTTPSSWFEKEILKRLWNSKREFDGGASEFHWMDAAFIPPILALKYDVPIVVYGKESAVIGNSYYSTTMFQPINGCIVQTQFDHLVRPRKGSVSIIHNGSDHFTALEPFN